jgi:lipid II:glycine glycyltransferase (peptidoglycan interpeptide bridge formation enzyme)
VAQGLSASARFASDDERARWNSLVASNPGGGEVWAGTEYATAKAFNGYHPRFVITEHLTGSGMLATLVLEKTVPLLGKLWYLPAGPAGSEPEEVLTASTAIAALAKREGAFMLKIEPRILESAQAKRAFLNAGFRQTFRIIPNESTVMLDVSGDEAEVSGRFAASCRNKIRRAEKEGLVIKRVEPTDENCRIMFDLLAETSAGRFELRPFEYYKLFWQTFAEANTGVLILGYKDEQPVAGLFGMILGETSVYKDGASVRQGLPTGSMNALQWELIQWAREHGAVRHDLCGAPHSSRVDDKTHPLYGVGQYKLAFNKEIIDHVGTFDLPLKPFAYKIWSVIGDRLARRLALKKRDDPYY